MAGRMALRLPPGPSTAGRCPSGASFSAAVMVPGALGLQEGGYVLVGAALGIPGEAALALALVKRARELALGLPSLVAWQWLGLNKGED